MKRFLLVFFVLFSLPVYAQSTNNQTQLRLVVVDETGAGIPNATIIITPAAGVAVTFSTDEKGVATSPTMLTGNVTVHVEFEGFQPYESPLALRRGAMNQTITLKIAGVQEEVVVSDTTATDDRRGNSFSTTLEESEIEELPDDPDELADVLAAMAGGSGAVFQVNGFRGGRLPTRDEIRQIRFRTNSFSADNHDAGRTQIEIITRPNVQQWAGNGSFNYRSDSMNARNAFSRSKTPEQNRNFNLGARGPIVKGKTSIRLGLDGRRDYQADTIVAIDEFGNRLGDYVRRPSDSTNATIGLEHALTNNQTLRLEYRRGRDLDGEQRRRRLQSSRACLQFVRQQQPGARAGPGHRRQEHAARSAAAGVLAGEQCGLGVGGSGHHRARRVQQRRRWRLEGRLLARVRARREPRLQRRPQTADARRLPARRRTLRELRRAEHRRNVHLRDDPGLSETGDR